MSAPKIAHRYAVALLSLVSGQQGLEDKLSNDLEAIAQLYDNPGIKKIIASPIVNPEILNAVFKNVFEQLQSPEILKNFIGTLIESRRTSVLPLMAKTFRILVQKSRGLLDATVTTAVVLQEAEVSEIRGKLEALLHKKINLVQKMDSSILGGFVIRVENSVIDMSLKTKLELLTKFAVS